MAEQWEIELEPEVRDWLELLPFRLYRRVEDKADGLLDELTTLGEPYSRHLGSLNVAVDEGDSHVTFTPHAA
ncbi:hypothetical protein [Streptomyces meridianus]|uniref:hypothetical protein n=1 Tax=Streptomyces meridianus TaxID=2938945 RepID=UPI0027E39318|nr:hypothetical protein [Streptomyces meridianus]